MSTLNCKNVAYVFIVNSLLLTIVGLLIYLVSVNPVASESQGEPLPDPDHSMIMSVDAGLCFDIARGYIPDYQGELDEICGFDYLNLKESARKAGYPVEGD